MNSTPVQCVERVVGNPGVCPANAWQIQSLLLDVLQRVKASPLWQAIALHISYRVFDQFA
jgi:hypothetical protein